MASQPPPEPNESHEITTNMARENSNSVDTYPDGGLRAWLVVLGAWCAMFPGMGMLNTLAVLHAWLSQNQLRHLPESSVGWVMSTYAFFLYLGGAQVGYVIMTSRLLY